MRRAGTQVRAANGRAQRKPDDVNARAHCSANHLLSNCRPDGRPDGKPNICAVHVPRVCPGLGVKSTGCGVDSNTRQLIALSAQYEN